MEKIIDIEDVLNNHMLKEVGNIMLTNYQIEVLKRYSIDPNNVSDLSELMSMIDNVLPDLNEEEYEELDSVYQMIAERNYYENTNK